MKKIILIRYAEIHLKGNNRAFFENLLVNNIKTALSGFDYEFTKSYGRYQVSNFDESLTKNIIEKLRCVFGIHSISEAFAVPGNLESIANAAAQLGVEKGTFKVECNRADKTFPMKSYEIAAHIGGELLKAFPTLSVDLHNPQYIISVDLRENKQAFVYSGTLEGSGGLPVGCSGKGMLLLSGGIDSPVAGYLMAKRGMRLYAVHFHSFPFTSREAKEKVLTLAGKLKRYANNITVYVVPFTQIQTEIHEKCKPEYLITLMRRCMMRIAQQLAKRCGAGALITGESLGQVASQTLESITVTNSVVDIPVFRPLIGWDKMEIIKLAEKIDTYSTSILPFEDCCTVFLPKNPVIKPSKVFAESLEKNLDLESLINAAVEKTETVEI